MRCEQFLPWHDPWPEGVTWRPTGDSFQESEGVYLLDGQPIDAYDWVVSESDGTGRRSVRPLEMVGLVDGAGIDELWPKCPKCGRRVAWREDAEHGLEFSCSTPCEWRLPGREERLAHGDLERMAKWAARGGGRLREVAVLVEELRAARRALDAYRDRGRASADHLAALRGLCAAVRSFMFCRDGAGMHFSTSHPEVRAVVDALERGEKLLL